MYMYSHQSLKLYIEKKRREMIESANHYGMSSEVTIKQSQELDVLLNQYRQILSKMKDKKVVNFF